MKKSNTFLVLAMLSSILMSLANIMHQDISFYLWLICTIVWTGLFFYACFKKKEKPKQTLADVFANMILRDTLIMVVQHEKTIEGLQESNGALVADNKLMLKHNAMLNKQIIDLKEQLNKCKDELCNHKEK